MPRTTHPSHLLRRAGGGTTGRRRSGAAVPAGAPAAADDSRFGHCGQERALTAYCNEDSVRAALHVPSVADIGPLLQAWYLEGTSPAPHL